MAKIVLGIGTGHTPLISEPPEFWPEHGAMELKAPHAMENAWGGGRVEELVKQRGAKLANEVTAEGQKKRYDQIQRSIVSVRGVLNRVKPDVLVHPHAIKTYDLQGTDALLVIEVAKTSLRYDLKTKLPLYASHGVREYWVINAATRITTVHRQPTGNVYSFTDELPSSARLIPPLVPELSVSLNELRLD